MAAKKASAKKASAKKAPAKKAAKKAGAKKSSQTTGLRVRMYRVGFGDFFLLTIPGKTPQHILIDCGVTPGTTHKGDIGTIKDAVADMAKETGNRLALVIMTHRHMDHIIGFSRSADVFKNIKVDAVWMPYWESEYDEHAKKFQAELTALALDVQQNLALYAGSDAEVDEMLGMLQNATGVEHTAFAAAAAESGGGKGTGGGSNAASLAMLKKGFGVEPQYYAKGQKAKLPKALADAGLTAEILGPPPDEAADTFMKLTDLKKGVGQYLGAGSGGGSGKNFLPFDRIWSTNTAPDFPNTVYDEWPADAKNDRIEKAVRRAQPSSLLASVKALDSFLNNQSLVVLFTFKGKKLLFVGDAQAGNWEYWMYGGSPEKNPAIDKLTAEGKQILGNLDFYKVGHHGSTNATPITAVDAMGGDFVSLCSTQIGAYGNPDKGTEVPRTPLIEALEKKSALIRSDQLALAKPKVAAAVKATVPKPSRGKFVVGPLYIDYLF